MMALDIATYPPIVEAVRREYEAVATVTVRPTAKGRAEIDAYHELAVRSRHRLVPTRGARPVTGGAGESVRICARGIAVPGHQVPHEQERRAPRDRRLCAAGARRGGQLCHRHVLAVQALGRAGARAAVGEPRRQLRAQRLRL